MKACVMLLMLLFSPVSCQTIVGTVQRIDGDQFQVKGRDGLTTFRADVNTQVAKVKKANDLSLLAVGDEVRVNYYGEGTPTAVNISVKVAVSGIISRAARNQVSVFRDATDDAATADRKVSVFVFLNATTKFAVGRDQLKVGRRIQVVGWDAGEGVIEAERIAVD